MNNQDLIVHRKYHTLDGIRGVAALIVLMRHAGYYFGNFGEWFSKSESYLAVDLFFVLSGFVIAEAYEHRLVQGLTWVEFIKIRLIRLYPLYLMGFLIGVVSAVFSILGNNTVGLTTVKLVEDSAFAFLMLPSPFSPDLYHLNIPSWSLFFELIANGLYAVVHPWLTEGKLILTMVITAMGLGLFAYENGNTDGGYLWTGFVVGLLRVTYSFGAGLLIHRLHTKIQIFRLPSWILLCLVFISLSVFPSNQFRPWYDMVVVVLLFPALVGIASASESGSKRVIQVYVFLGTTSYAIYILHKTFESFIEGALRAIFKCDVGQFAPYSGIVFLLCFTCICWWLDHFYDGPIRRWATKKFLKDKYI